MCLVGIYCVALLYLDVEFAFEESTYFVGEEMGSIEVCVLVVSGELSADVTLSIRPEVDGDPSSLDGN